MKEHLKVNVGLNLYNFNIEVFKDLMAFNGLKLMDTYHAGTTLREFEDTFYSSKGKENTITYLDFAGALYHKETLDQKGDMYKINLHSTSLTSIIPKDGYELNDIDVTSIDLNDFAFIGIDFSFPKFRFDSENSSTSAENYAANRNLNSYILDKLIVGETALGLEKPLVIQQNLFEVDEKELKEKQSHL